MKQFTIIGLGRFGLALATNLVSLGHNVIGIDSNQKIVDKCADLMTLVVNCDATDKGCLAELNIQESDAVIVSIGSDIQASLLTIFALKELNTPTIWVKSNSKEHHTIVSKLGVSKIIHPEEDIAQHVSISLNYPMIEDFISMGDGVYSVSIKIKEKFNHVKISDLITKHFNEIHPLLVKRNEEIFAPVSPDFVLHFGDTFLLTAEHEKLIAIANLFS
ncbi:potassium channel family protein [Thorsellia kenyensis]|uniref:Potassium channel family protein n=1 Tax=Thorsellia kenyensis TaxID=1549888 RepID=A0ABV6C732_9GAMM